MPVQQLCSCRLLMPGGELRYSLCVPFEGCAQQPHPDGKNDHSIRGAEPC